MDLGKNRLASVASALPGALTPHLLGPGPSLNSVPLGRPGPLVAPVVQPRACPTDCSLLTMVTSALAKGWLGQVLQLVKTQ